MLTNVLIVTHICTVYTYLYVAAPTIWNILLSNVRSACNITKLNCHLKHTFKHCHAWSRLYHVNTKLLPCCNVDTRGKESTTSIPLSPNCYHLATLSRTAMNLPHQFNFHQTTTILQRHIWPRIYHVNSTFTKLPPFYNVTHGHESTTSIPLSPNYHHFTTSHMATNLLRQYHFHQTATILQRHT